MISLSMIVKNEAEHIERALTSAAPWVDEIIVVDTGSTDRTRELARAMGAHVLDHKWTGFSQARNFGIEACSGDWILILDADEELDHESGQEIRRLTALNGLVGFRCIQRHYFSGRLPIDTPVVRLFRNDTSLRFSGVLHERVTSTQHGYMQYPSRILIHHRIGPENNSSRVDKNGWYEKVLRDEILASPQCAESHMNLALILNQIGRYPESIASLRESLEWVPDKAEYIALIYLAMSEAYFAIGDFPASRKACENGLAYAPEYPSLLYNAGLCEARLNRFAQARRLARKAILASKHYHGNFPLDHNIEHVLAPDLLRLARRVKG